MMRFNLIQCSEGRQWEAKERMAYLEEKALEIDKILTRKFTEPIPLLYYHGHEFPSKHSWANGTCVMYAGDPHFRHVGLHMSLDNRWEGHDVDLNAIGPHEYAHWTLHERCGYRGIPPVFNEGIACVLAGQINPKVRPRAKLTTLLELNVNFYDNVDNDNVDNYGLASHLAYYISVQVGLKKFIDMLAGVGIKMTIYNLFEDIETLEIGFKNYLNNLGRSA